MAAAVTEIWRYPVKSMGGEQVGASALGQRGLHADRMWAVRDQVRDVITTARQLPALLRCTARYPTDPERVAAGPGNAPDVLITMPNGAEVSSSDAQVHARLSELVDRHVRLEPLPPVTEKKRHRAPRHTKAELREFFGLTDDEPLPDLSVFPIRKLAELGRYVTPVGSYSDAYPLHLITRGSLAAMAAHKPTSNFDVKRFRPNLVVDTGAEDELAENAWCGGELHGPDTSLSVEIPTIRCVIPTRSQVDLPADPDVLRAVAARADRCLGVYASVQRPGQIAVGDELQVRLPKPRPRVGTITQAGGTAAKRAGLRAAAALTQDG